MSGELKAPRFRLLILGKAGAGKTSLINQAFGVDLRVEHERAGQHRIQDEIISPNNDMFILHDSEGFERLNTPTYHVVRNFIEERCKRPELEEQLHAIWLCSSLVGSSIFEKSDEEVLTRHNHLPVVMVFTKFDQFKGEIRLDIVDNQGTEDQVNDLVETEVREKLKKNCLDPLSRITGTDTYPRAVVSVNAPHGERVRELIRITQELLINKFGALKNNTAALAGSIAQRVNPDDKIESSIKVIVEDGSGRFDGMAPLEHRLRRVHKDLVEIWNFKDDGKLLSEDGCLSKLRSDLCDDKSGEMASSGLQSPVQKKTIVLELMTYVMDLTMLLRATFHQTRTTQGVVPLSDALLNQVLEAYIKGPKSSIRIAITKYVNNMQEFSSEHAAREIRDLIRGNRFDFKVGIPTPQTLDDTVDGTRRILGSMSSGSDTPNQQYEAFIRTAGDDADRHIYTLELKIKPSFMAMPFRKGSTTVKVLQTHQKFESVKVQNKWAAVLGFRLEITGVKPEHLKLTGNLQDTRRTSAGKLEIANVWPYRPSGDHSKPPVIQRGASTTVTMTGGISGFLPNLRLGISGGGTDTWAETHEVIRTRFENASPRMTFGMDFSPRPNKKGVPDALSFAVLVAFPARPVAFDLEFQIDRGDVSGQCTFECDGKTEIEKSVALFS